jgi:hypothetical protein
VSLEPAWDAITPLDPDMIDLCLGSVTPARETLQEGLSCLLEAIDQGEGRYLLLHENGRPRPFCSWACRSIEHLEAQSDGARRFDSSRASAAWDPFCSAAGQPPGDR